MRRLVVAAFAAGLLAPAAADAAPRTACRPVLTDPRGDTYESLGLDHDEPGADITALHLRSDAKNLTVTVTIADVDAPITTAPLGRSIWVMFRTGEASFLARHVAGVDASNAELSVGEVDQAAGNENAGGSAWAGTEVADIPFSVDTKRNQVRMEVPLELLREHAGSAAKGQRVQVTDVSTYDVEGLSDYHSGGTIDTSYPRDGSYRLGAGGC